MRYADFLQIHLLDPIGAVDTGFHVGPDQHHRLVKLYAAKPFIGGLEECQKMRFPRPGSPTFHPLDVTKQPGADLGGAGLAGTVDDVLRFAMMLAGGGTLGEASVLKPESVAELSRGRVIDRIGRHAMMKMPLDERAVGLDMGLGVVVVRDPDLARDAGAKGSFSFGGSTGTRFWVDPDLELAAVFFTQTMNSPAPYFAPFGRFVYDALRAGDGR
jgi:CubicO group peptidase (beta-lactamase class C family)